MTVVMAESVDEMVVPQCSGPTSGTERIGLGKYGLQYDVPTKQAKIIRGKVNTDYIRHTVKPKKGGGWLELWFGPYAMSSLPDDKDIQGSTDLKQRSVVNNKGGTIGLDTRGKAVDGNWWRQTSIISDGARYRAPEEVATLFDQIVNSACLIPYPTK